MTKKQIELIKPTLNESPGDVVTIDYESDTALYYYDAFRRFCYVLKEEEGTHFRYVTEDKP